MKWDAHFLVDNWSRGDRSTVTQSRICDRDADAAAARRSNTSWDGKITEARGLWLILRSKKKNDRVDAEKLAKLLYLGEVPTIHVPSLDVRSWRSLVEHRQRVVAERTRCKNSLRALLRAHGITPPKCLWSGKGLAWLRSAELTTDADRLRRDLTIEALAHATRRRQTIDEHLARIDATHPGVALLMTIPGVGICTASAVVAYIDDPQRFARNRAIGSYFGLVPSQDASGSVNRLGHISREGPPTVRMLVTEAAWHASRRSRTVKAYFERVMRDDPDRRKIALVATGLIEMYLAGVSMRRVEDITEALGGTRTSASTVSSMAQKVYGQIEGRRSRPLTASGGHAYVYLDGIWLKRSWGGEVRNVAVLIAIGVDADGYREVLSVSEGTKEDAQSWRNFLRNLKERGLSGVKLFISDKCLGLVESLTEFYPQASWQRCVVHWYRNAMSAVPQGKVREVVAMLKAIHAQEDRENAEAKAAAVVEKLESMKLGKAATIVRKGVSETLAYMSFPREHWRCLRTNNPLERLNREVRRRTRVVGAFPDGQSALMLVAARLRHVAGTKWGLRRYLDMGRLREMEGGQTLQAPA